MIKREKICLFSCSIQVNTYEKSIEDKIIVVAQKMIRRYTATCSCAYNSYTISTFKISLDSFIVTTITGNKGNDSFQLKKKTKKKLNFL